MTLDVRSAKKSESGLMEDLMQDYLAEFATFESVDQDENGRYLYPYLPFYWEDPYRYPFLFRQGDEVVGFALVRFDVDPASGHESLELAEFYIVPSHRRAGLGRAAARFLWNLFPGRWHVRVLKSNKNAYPFWKRVIADYTGNQFNEAPPGSAIGGFHAFTFKSEVEAELPDDLDDFVDY